MMGGLWGGTGCCGFGTYGWLGLILNLVILVGVIAGIVLLIVWVVRRLSSETSNRSGSLSETEAESSPDEILRLRYARGEITREQYQEILADLG